MYRQLHMTLSVGSTVVTNAAVRRRQSPLDSLQSMDSPAASLNRNDPAADDATDAYWND